MNDGGALHQEQLAAPGVPSVLTFNSIDVETANVQSTPPYLPLIRPKHTP